MLLLSQDETARCLPIAECVEVVDEAFRASGCGGVTVGGERRAGA